MRKQLYSVQEHVKHSFERESPGDMQRELVDQKNGSIIIDPI